MSTPTLSSTEFRVLRSASRAYAYQPVAVDMPAADSLIARRLLARRADFPAALCLTDDGERAYRAEDNRRDVLEEQRRDDRDDRADRARRRDARISGG